MDLIVADIPQENSIVVSNEPNNIVVKQFQHLNIEIYGTYEEPLFKAKDIGDMLEIKNIRKTIERLDDDCKMKLNVTNGYAGNSDTWFLTEDGMYEVLMISRKTIAKQFKKWVRTVIKEIRLNTNNSLETRIKELEFFKEPSYEVMPLDENVYCNSTDIVGIFKIGKAIDIKQRKGGSQTPCVKNIETLHYVKTVDGELLEKMIHLTLNKYRVSKREHFRCRLDHIKLVMDKCAKFINTMACTRQSITPEEVTEKLEMSLPVQEFLPVISESKQETKITKQLNSIQEQIQKNKSEEIIVKQIHKISEQIQKNKKEMSQEINSLKKTKKHRQPTNNQVNLLAEDIDIDELFPPDHRPLIEELN